MAHRSALCRTQTLPGCPRQAYELQRRMCWPLLAPPSPLDGLCFGVLPSRVLTGGLCARACSRPPCLGLHEASCCSYFRCAAWPTVGAACSGADVGRHATSPCSPFLQARLLAAARSVSVEHIRLKSVSAHSARLTVAVPARKLCGCCAQLCLHACRGSETWPSFRQPTG